MIRRRVLNYIKEEYPKGFSYDSRHSESEFDYCYINDLKKEFLLLNHRHISHNNTLTSIVTPVIWFEEFTQELNTDYSISDDIFIKKSNSNRIKKLIEKLNNIATRRII